MKTLKFTLTLILASLGSSVLAQNGIEPPKSYADKLMPDIEIGTLMCKDDHGKLMKCNGDEFDQIVGFATSTPYITCNKKDPKDTEVGFIAKPEGRLTVGDYVRASKNGKVSKCDKEIAYAKVVAVNGQSLRVRIISN